MRQKSRSGEELKRRREKRGMAEVQEVGRGERYREKRRAERRAEAEEIGVRIQRRKNRGRGVRMQNKDKSGNRKQNPTEEQC